MYYKHNFMKYIFRNKTLIYLVERDDEEPFEYLMDRGYFIANQMPQNDDEYNNALLYSRIYINHKYFGCIYNNVIMNELNKMIVKL